MMTNFRHWAGVLRRQAHYLRDRAEHLADEAKVSTGAYAVLHAQADAFERGADAIEEALALDKEVRQALVDVRELARAADPVE
ncbi:MAG: hypothetical protein AB1609_15670 [Bacillota bacterium]